MVMDRQERERIISSVHDEAHLGRDKTLAQINRNYYWPDMYKEICAYVSKVPGCNISKITHVLDACPWLGVICMQLLSFSAVMVLSHMQLFSFVDQFL